MVYCLLSRETWFGNRHFSDADGDKPHVNYGSIAHEAKPKWTIDPWPLRAKGLIVLVSPN